MLDHIEENVLAHISIQSTQNIVENVNLRLTIQASGNGNSLLLTT